MHCMLSYESVSWDRRRTWSRLCDAARWDRRTEYGLDCDSTVHGVPLCRNWCTQDFRTQFRVYCSAIFGHKKCCRALYWNCIVRLSIVELKIGQIEQGPSQTREGNRFSVSTKYIRKIFDRGCGSWVRVFVLEPYVSNMYACWKSMTMYSPNGFCT